MDDKPQSKWLDKVGELRPVMIDVEASGFGRGSYPIEVGVAFADGHTECMIIRPETDWQHWDSEAEGLHGISRAVLEQSGKPVEHVARWLDDCLAGEMVYSDAWGNDSSWLALLFDRAQMLQRFRVTPLYSLLSEQQIAVWHSTKTSLINQGGYSRHRASQDAHILQETFYQTEARLAQQRFR
jgi:hypothetical protein